MFSPIKSILISLLLLFGGTQQAWSQNGGSASAGGNGGEVVDVGGHLWLRDLRENSNCFYTKASDYANTIPETRQVLNKIGEVNWFLESLLNGQLENVTICLTHAVLNHVPTEDEDAVTPVRISDTQALAIRYANTVYLNIDLMAQLPSDQKAFALIHEMTHGLIPQNTIRRNNKVRSMVASLNLLYHSGMTDQVLGLQIEMNSVESMRITTGYDSMRESVSELNLSLPRAVGEPPNVAMVSVARILRANPNNPDLVWIETNFKKVFNNLYIENWNTPNEVYKSWMSSLLQNVRNHNYAVAAMQLAVFNEISVFCIARNPQVPCQSDSIFRAGGGWDYNGSRFRSHISTAILESISGLNDEGYSQLRTLILPKVLPVLYDVMLTLVSQDHPSWLAALTQNDFMRLEMQQIGGQTKRVYSWDHLAIPGRYIFGERQSNSYGQYYSVIAEDRLETLPATAIAWLNEILDSNETAEQKWIKVRIYLSLFNVTFNHLSALGAAANFSSLFAEETVSRILDLSKAAGVGIPYEYLEHLQNLGRSLQPVMRLFPLILQRNYTQDEVFNATRSTFNYGGERYGLLAMAFYAVNYPTCQTCAADRSVINAVLNFYERLHLDWADDFSRIQLQEYEPNLNAFREILYRFRDSTYRLPGAAIYSPSRMRSAIYLHGSFSDIQALIEIYHRSRIPLDLPCDGNGFTCANGWGHPRTVFKFLREHRSRSFARQVRRMIRHLD